MSLSVSIGTTLQRRPECRDERGQDCQSRADADQGSAPTAHDPDAEHDRQRLDHLDRAGEEGPEDEQEGARGHAEARIGRGVWFPARRVIPAPAVPSERNLVTFIGLLLVILLVVVIWRMAVRGR